jgi:hypothetical protein
VPASIFAVVAVENTVGVVLLPDGLSASTRRWMKSPTRHMLVGRPFNRLTVSQSLGQPEELRRVVIENVALLLWSKEVGRPNAVDGHFNHLRPYHLV